MAMYLIAGLLGLAAGLAFPDARARLLVVGVLLIAAATIVLAIVQSDDVRAERSPPLYAMLATMSFVAWTVFMLIGSFVRGRMSGAPRASAAD